MTPEQQSAQRRWLKPGDIVFDIGANRGEWTESALKAQPDLQIHAFEPDPGAFELLSAAYPNIRKTKTAVGRRAETRHFFCCGNSAYSNLYNWEPGDVIAEIETPVITIDSYVESHGIGQIGFCKIDVEGHELHVLIGAKKTLCRMRVIQFEWVAPGKVPLEDLRAVLDGFDVQPLGDRINYLALRQD